MLLGLFVLGVLGFVVPAKSKTVIPIIDAVTGQLYGGVSEENWLSATETKDSVSEEMVFNAYSKNGTFLQNTKLIYAQTDEICFNPTFRPKEPLAHGAVILVGASLNTPIRKPVELNRNNLIYQKALAHWLQEQGINDSRPNLSQLLRIDLEDDGNDEVIIAATRHRGGATSTQAGDYSLLILRKLIDGIVATFPIISDTFLEDCIAECALDRHEVINVLDLNGNGKLEIITKSSGYESTTQAIYSLENHGIEKRLEWTCGP